MLSKDIIIDEIIPYLSKSKRGPLPVVELYQIVQAVFYKLKTGCQWSMIPMEKFFKVDYSYSSVYHHYRKWVKNNSWSNLWVTTLIQNKNILEMSSVEVDGSHTPAKKGGDAVGYQGRKKSKTTNLIFLSDNAGNMLGLSDAYSGNHHDLYKIKEGMVQMFSSIESAGIPVSGLFLNADAGFDGKEMKKACYKMKLIPNIDKNKRNGSNDKENEVFHVFDEELYKNRFVIERANAWIDAFKTLLVRFTVKSENWIALHYMALTNRLILRRINNEM